MSSANSLNKILGLALWGALLAAGCSLPKQAGLADAVAPPREKPFLAVLPIHNLSRMPAPLKEMRQALIAGTVGQRVPVLSDESLEPFMQRHRVRYTGGLDIATATAFREEAGIEAVLVTTLEQYAPIYPPKIALTARLVSTGEMPRILWMESVAIAGDDHPGLFGVGYIDDIKVLLQKAIAELNASLSKFFMANRPGEKTEATWLYNPKIVYHSRFMAPARKYTIAVTPFLNRSRTNYAGEIVALHFIDQLFKTGDFDILDPGVVREKLLLNRMIMPEGVSLADIDLLVNSLDTDFVLAGKVLSYVDNSAIGEGIPKAEFNISVFERKSKRAVWASQSYNAGMDGVFFFDWHKINTAGSLTTKMAASAIRAMVEKDPRLLQNQAFRQGPWASITFPPRR